MELEEDQMRHCGRRSTDYLPTCRLLSARLLRLRISHLPSAVSVQCLFCLSGQPRKAPCPPEDLFNARGILAYTF
eukprot:2984741-Amphidinium_carterae.1